jgi:hypothetical protein
MKKQLFASCPHTVGGGGFVAQNKFKTSVKRSGVAIPQKPLRNRLIIPAFQNSTLKYLTRTY